MNKYDHRNYYITVMAIKTENLVTESELQYILYLLVITFIFTSSKCDVIIYCSYDPYLNACHAQKMTRQKKYVYICSMELNKYIYNLAASLRHRS